MVSLVKVGTALALGAANIAAEEYDKKTGKTMPLERVQDAVRLGALAIGFFGEEIGLPADVAESLLIASIPLAMETVYEAVKEYALKKQGYQPVILVRAEEGRQSTPAHSEARAEASVSAGRPIAVSF